MIADIIVFSVVLLFVYNGYRSGLIKTMYGLFSYILSILISIMIYPHISSMILKNPEIYNFISKIAEKMTVSGALENKNPLIAFILPSVNNSINNLITGLLINVFSFIIVLIVSRLALGIISKSLNIVAKLPVISTLNKIGGAVVGGFKGIVVLYIVFLVLFFVPGIFDGKVAENVSKSQIANKFYTENIIVDVLGKDVLNINAK